LPLRDIEGIPRYRRHSKTQGKLIGTQLFFKEKKAFLGMDASREETIIGKEETDRAGWALKYLVQGHPST
jgi:hypothetical protein